jgi:hypothetical protein
MHTVEQCLKFDLHKLIKAGTIVPGARCTGRLGFDNTRFHIGFEYLPGQLTIRYPNGSQQRFEIIEHRAGFATRLYMMVDGRRCSILYLPPGGNVFHTRSAWRLKYAYWTMSMNRRRERRGAAIRARLSGRYDTLIKPRGMSRDAWMKKLITLAEYEDARR